MNLKDRLIRKLLNVGKKHRILVYPTLAMVAVISAISHAIYWGRGNGKKLVASAMVMVMLFTQSLFLTSSAGGSEGGSPEAQAGEEAGEVTESETEYVTVYYYLVDKDGNAQPYEQGGQPVPVDADGKITVNVPDDTQKAEWFFGDSEQSANFTFSECFTDAAMTSVISEGTQTIAKPVDESGETTDLNIFFKATRTQYPFVISDSETEYYSGNIAVPDTVTPGDIAPVVEYYVNSADTYSAYKRGCIFNGLSYEGGQYAVGAAIRIADDRFVDRLVFTPQWTPMNFEVEFVATDDGNVNWPSGLEFPSAVTLNDSSVNIVKKNNIPYTDTSVDLYTDADIWAYNEAYILSGWYDSTHDKYYYDSTANAKSLATSLGDLKDNPNIEGVRLYAVWKYRNVVLDINSGDGNMASVDCGDDRINAAVTASYGDKVDFTINAEYKDGRAEDKAGTQFTYEIGSVDGTSGDAVLAKYGLTGAQITDKNNMKVGYEIRGKLTDVTPEENVVIPLKITDNNNSSVTEHSIILDINRKQVTIDSSTIKGDHGSSEPPKKQYNGLASIGVNNTAQVLGDSSSLSGKLDGDEVYVSLSSEATLDDVNASDGLKGITLHKVKLTGAQADKYVLVDSDGVEVEDEGDLHIASIATVNRCDVKVEIVRVDGTDNPVLFGQANPDYVLSITDPVSLAGDASTAGSEEYMYVNASSTEDKMRFISDVLGFTGWETTPERALFSPVGTYYIEPVFNRDSSNYKVDTVGDKVQFEVVQEEAVRDVNYKYSTQMADNGFYPGLKIIPTGGYTLIREIKDGEQPVDASTTMNDISSWFKTEIVIDDCVDKTIRFQMYKPIDSSDISKGCSVTTVAVDTVSVDNSVPVYVSHSLADNVKDKVNTNMSFGSYYHAHDGVESISLTFVYNSEYSTCETLHYYFLPEGSNKKGGEITTRMENIPGTNNYTGTVTIGTANSGQLIVYAENTTGGVSVSKRIKIEGADDFDIDNADPDNGYYEWMVENNPIAISDIVVSNMDGEVITDYNAWYNGIKFSTYVKDSQSGINRIEWKVVDSNGAVVDTDYSNIFELADMSAVVKDYGKIMEYTFKNSISSEDLPVGDYYVSAVVYDNAWNKTELSAVGPFRVDCHAPVIKDITSNDNSGYISNVVFEFTVSEPDYESGVDIVYAYDITDDPDAPGLALSPVDDGNLYKLNINKNSKYKIVAIDKAGNKRTYEKSFEGVSDERPSKPVISFEGTVGSNDWYKEVPAAIHISASTQTSDGVPVNTQYRIIYEDRDSTGVVPTAQADDYEIPLTKDGVIAVEAWSVSEADLESGIASAQIKVDTMAPELVIGESGVDEEGNIVINYTVNDITSGVAEILINGEPAEYTLDGNTAKGSFAVEETKKEYVISATDVAGNTSGDKGFEPLSLVAGSILNISPNSAYVEADVYEGTYELDDCYVAYRVHGDKSYSTALVAKEVTDYGVHMACDFRKLSPDTLYDYKIYAITKTSKEVQVVEGTFRTSSDKAGGAIRGTVAYGDALLEDYDKYPIYVTLYDGNTVVAGDVIIDDTEKDYLFTNVVDGTYRIVATDGLLSETEKVVVANGGIVSPENYLVNNGINLTLDGFSTAVVIEDNSINLTADGLDKVFDSIDYFEGVITKEDKDNVTNGGSIEIALHAKYVDKAELDEAELDVFEENMSSDEHIEKYISVYIVKSVRDAQGELVYEPTVVPMLYDDLKISFPLGELAGQRVYVAMTHLEKSGEYSFIKWNDESKATITQNYVTISSNLFSTYALYTVDKPLETHVVKWMSDGVVIKSEIIQHGGMATPPTKLPTKASDDMFTYRFGGWSITDFSNITEDTVISAWFVKTKKNSGSKPSDDDKTTEKEPPETDKPTTEKDPEKDDDDSRKPNTEDPDDNKTTEDDNRTTEDGKDDIKKEPTKDVYLGSNESPKTGDEAPIVAMIMLMTVSLAGVIIVKRKQIAEREENDN